MNILIDVINCIAQALGISLTVYYLNQSIGRGKKEWLKLFLLILAIDLITFGNSEYLSIPAIFLISMFYTYSRNKVILMNFVSLLVCIIAQCIIIIIFALISLILPHNIDYYRENLWYNLFCGAFYVSVTFLLKRVYQSMGNKINSFLAVKFKPSKLIVNVLGVNIVLIILYLYTVPIINTHMNSKTFVAVYTSIIVIFVLYSFSSFYIYSYILRIEKQKAESKLQLDLSVKFQQAVEKMYDDVMNFKHDYIKIYSSFKMFIENKDYSSLETYFNENITPLQGKLQTKNSNSKQILNIKDVALQGVVYSYILKSQSKSVLFILDIQEEIDNINMQIIDLCRIIGIFLDNAIEECEGISHSQIDLCMTRKEEAVAIIVTNTYQAENNRSFNQCISTKGENRGRGLQIVGSITNTYKNVFHNTIIKEDKFIQELWIEDKKKRL